jgi:hypothetical protein
MLAFNFVNLALNNSLFTQLNKLFLPLETDDDDKCAL